MKFATLPRHHPVSGKRGGTERVGRTPAAVILGCYKKTDFVALSRITIFCIFYIVLQHSHATKLQKQWRIEHSCSSSMHSSVAQPLLRAKPTQQSAATRAAASPSHAVLRKTSGVYLWERQQRPRQQSVLRLFWISLFFHPKPKHKTKKTHTTPKNTTAQIFPIVDLPNLLWSWKWNPSISTHVLWKQCPVITEQNSNQWPIWKLLWKNLPHFSLAVP